MGSKSSTARTSSAKEKEPLNAKGRKKAKIEAAVEAPAIQIPTAPRRKSKVTQTDFMKHLTEKLSHFDARIILEAAMISAGIDAREDTFNKNETKEICLALIRRGGPAYAVGARIYREVVG